LQLAVRHEQPGVGRQLLHVLGGLVDRLDAVVQVEDLPAARELLLDCDARTRSSRYSPM
jgi:hypothetical protein